MNKNKQTHNYNYNLDLLRSIATFFVIFIHATAIEIEKVHNSSRVSLFLWILLQSFARAAIPVFLMLTGYLLLNNRSSLGEFKRRIFRILKPLIFWSIFYALIYQKKSINSLSETLVFITNCVLNPHYHLWYLQMILFVYFGLPLLRKIALIIKRDNVLIFYFIYSFLNCFLVFIQSYISLNLNRFLMGFGIDFFPLFYLFFGYLFSQKSILQKINRLKFLTKKSCFFIYAFGSILHSLASIAYYSVHKINYPGIPEVSSIFVACSSISFFLFVFKLEINKNNKFLVLILSFLSKKSFSVYLIHIIILDTLNKINIFYNPSSLIALKNGFHIINFVFFVTKILLCWIISYGIVFCAKVTIAKINKQLSEIIFP